MNVLGINAVLSDRHPRAAVADGPDVLMRRTESLVERFR